MGQITSPSSRWYEALGPWGRYAVEEAFESYGHLLKPKWKQLRKFGRTLIPVKDVRNTIMTQGSTAVVNEAYTTANTIDSVIASTTATQSLYVEGHTIDTSGDLTFVSQNVTLASSVRVALTTPLARCNRLAINPGTFASPAADNIANIYAYQSTKTGVSGGIPSSAVHVNCMISSGFNQSNKAATVTSFKDYWLVTGIVASLPQAASPTGTVALDVDLEIRLKGGVFRPTGGQVAIGAGDRTAHRTYDPYILVPPNSDIRMIATASTGDVAVTGTMEGFLLGVSTGDKS